MNNKYITISLEGDQAGKIAEVLGNKTCKKILALLAEKEASESDLANELKIPMNTAEYNIHKLVEASLIEKASHWWSVKGKKIPVYRLANKYIVIAPKKSNFSKFIPVALFSGAAAFLIRYFTSMNQSSQLNLASEMGEKAYVAAPSAATSIVDGAGEMLTNTAPLVDRALAMPVWAWFLIGAGFALLVLLIFNWKKLKGGFD